MEYKIEHSKVETSLQLVEERTSLKFTNLKNTVKDITSEFNYPEEVILKAIRNGGFGYYGITRHLSTQLICIWIRTYIESRGNVDIGMARMALTSSKDTLNSLINKGWTSQELENIVNNAN